ARLGAGLVRERLRELLVRVVDRDELVRSGQRVRPLLPDEATTDDTDLHFFSANIVPSIRRSVYIGDLFVASTSSSWTLSHFAENSFPVSLPLFSDASHATRFAASSGDSPPAL